jgi:phosphatidylinositol 4-kinase
MIRTAWNVDAAIATHMTERFKRPIVESEVTKLVKSDPSAALHVPEAVKFFIGDRFTRGQKRDYKVCIEVGICYLPCSEFVCSCF